MSDTTRRLALVTTARSDYNLMQPLMSAAQADSRFDARIFVAAMHLLPRFGETWRLVEADGLPIQEKVPFLGEDDTRPALAAGLARGAGVFAEALERQVPDIVVLLGDRIEMMPLAMATAALGLPLAHLCGGDITEGA
ncbi:MAG: UDP-N-acetylglucosamine 2-epimerase [Pseudomonadota bacterium]